MKTLVIINGVTGAIGTACLAQFSRQPETTVFGLSRQAMDFSQFTVGGYLPDRTLICSIGDVIDAASCLAFVKAIDVSRYDRLVYIHAIGVYPFELDERGALKISHDDNGDGIDDRVMKLTHDAFFAMSDTLKAAHPNVSALLFGGIADKHQPAVHASWWSVLERVRTEMHHNLSLGKQIRYRILNISSVICAHELLTRPYVFQRTDADPRFWLMPHEVAQQAVALTLSESEKKFIEYDLFHPATYYHADYFKDENFTERKKAELGLM